MKKIKEMIKTAFDKKDAMNMLETFRTFGNIPNKEYIKARELISKEFKR